MKNEDWEMQCYGVREETLKTMVEDGKKLGSVRMIAMSMLSDAQEMIERNLNEIARQEINKAKWIISTYLKDPPDATLNENFIKQGISH